MASKVNHSIDLELYGIRYPHRPVDRWIYLGLLSLRLGRKHPNVTTTPYRQRKIPQDGESLSLRIAARLSRRSSP